MFFLEMYHFPHTTADFAKMTWDIFRFTHITDSFLKKVMFLEFYRYVDNE